MNNINDLFKNEWVTKGIKVVITVLISYLLYTIINRIINRNIKKGRLKQIENKKTATYIRLLRSINRYIFITITILTILQILEINVSSIIAGVGVLGIVFGLAIQDFLKDIIRGSSILSDDYFSVGDVVKYDNIEGKVLILGLKSTKIQDLRTSNIISIANRNIDKIEVVSEYLYINVPMPYEVKLDKAEKAMNDIVNKINKLDNVLACEYKGVNELAESSILYLIQIKCNPKNKLQIRRNSLKEILLGLESNNIVVPYNQIDVHQK